MNKTRPIDKNEENQFNLGRGVGIRYSGRVNISCPTCDARRCQTWCIRLTEYNGGWCVLKVMQFGL